EAGELCLLRHAVTFKNRHAGDADLCRRCCRQGTFPAGVDDCGGLTVKKHRGVRGRLNLRIHSGLAHAAGDRLGGVSAEVNNENGAGRSHALRIRTLLREQVVCLLMATLHTPRLVLSAPTSEDVPAITAACQDAEIQRWTTIPSPYERRDAEGFIEIVNDG